MRAVIQRVLEASVHVEGQRVGEIGAGLMVLIGAGSSDTDRDAKFLVDKIVNLRIFTDAAGKMNLSLLDVAGEVLGISQFTLYGDARRGRRPSFGAAMEPVRAEELYLQVIEGMGKAGAKKVAKGTFGADMEISLVGNGPVTILIDSEKLF